jgi:hypothetical protein
VPLASGVARGSDGLTAVVGAAAAVLGALLGGAYAAAAKRRGGGGGGGGGSAARFRLASSSPPRGLVAPQPQQQWQQQQQQQQPAPDAALPGEAGGWRERRARRPGGRERAARARERLCTAYLRVHVFSRENPSPHPAPPAGPHPAAGLASLPSPLEHARGLVLKGLGSPAAPRDGDSSARRGWGPTAAHKAAVTPGSAAAADPASLGASLAGGGFFAPPPAAAPLAAAESNSDRTTTSARSLEAAERGRARSAGGAGAAALALREPVLERPPHADSARGSARQRRVAKKSLSGTDVYALF